MSPRAWLTGLTAIVLVAAVAGCATTASSVPPGVIGTGPGGLRVYTWAAAAGGTPAACPAFAAEHPVSGVLRGDPSDPQDPIWLEGQGGVRLSIVWPAGFSVTFEPTAVLRDERGVVVARAGDRVELGQVDAFGNTGLFSDPYFASGIVFAGCYPFVRRPSGSAP